MPVVVQPGTVLLEGSGDALAPLHGAVRAYDWGSRTALAELQGRSSPTTLPEAELWFGAHPSAPAALERASGRVGLDAAIARDPVAELGAVHVERFGARLPFLVKLLAAERALSIQLHPRAEDAARGHAEEERRGLALDDPERGHPDPWGKSELVVALTSFEARVDLRPIERAVSVLEGIAPDALDVLGTASTRPSADGPAGTLELAAALLASDVDARRDVVARVVAGANARLTDGDRRGTDPLLDEARTVVRLAGERPGDLGIVLALLLDAVRLGPGEALEVLPGVVHSYQGGTAVEVMVASDCVLRLGLTDKAVRAEEAIAAVATELTSRRLGVGDASGALWSLATRPEEFRVATTEVAGALRWRTDERAPGPALLLCTEGEVVGSADGDVVSLGRGGCLFASARAGTVSLEGEGRLLLVTVGPASGG